MPTVSIGMPVYNGEKYIAEALESLLAQTYTDFEILIADNRSTDNTLEIAQAFAAKDSRIQVMTREENRGAVENFNYVFHQTTGEFFKWAAADDICKPDFLKECVTLLKDNPEVIWCHTESDKIDADGNSLLPWVDKDDASIETDGAGKRRWTALPRIDSDSDISCRRFAGVLLGTNWCVDSYGLIRRKALQRTRLVVDLYGAEKVLMAELSLQGKYGHIERQLFAQRIHLSASSAIEDEAAQVSYVGPSRKRFASTRLLLLQAHCWSVLRSQQPWLMKIRCMCSLTAYVLQIRKWGRVLKSFFSGRGVGGAGKRLLDEVSQQKQKPSSKDSA